MNFVQPFIDFASFSFRTNLLFLQGVFLLCYLYWEEYIIFFFEFFLQQLCYVL